MARYSRVSSEDMLEQENQNMTENLSGKVARLKALAFDIDSDVREHNSYLGTMDGEFDSGTGLLSGSMKRINNVISNNKNNKKLMCYIIMALVGLFVIMYYFVSRFTGGGK